MRLGCEDSDKSKEAQVEVEQNSGASQIARSCKLRTRAHANLSACLACKKVRGLGITPLRKQRVAC